MNEMDGYLKAQQKLLSELSEYLDNLFVLAASLSAVHFIAFVVLCFSIFMTLRTLNQWLQAKTRTEELLQQKTQLEIEGRR